MLAFQSYISNLSILQQQSHRHIMFINGAKIHWMHEYPCIDLECPQCKQYISKQYVARRTCNYCKTELDISKAYKARILLYVSVADPSVSIKKEIYGYASNDLSIAILHNITKSKAIVDAASFVQYLKSHKVYSISKNYCIKDIKVIICKNKNSKNISITFEDKKE